MSMLIEQPSLLALVDAARRVTPRTSTKPVLTHLLLTALDGLTVTATDGEMAYRSATPAQVHSPFQVAAPAADLVQLVKSLPKQSVELAHHPDEHTLELRCGTIQFSLNVLPGDEFPILPDLHPSEQVIYPARTLEQIFSRTLYAVSQEETRYYLGGVYLEATTDGPAQVLRAAATDGHRLSLAQTPLLSPLPWDKGMIVPRKLLTELLSALSSHKGDVTFGQGKDRRLTFSFAHTTLSSLLVEGSFPDYRQVIPPVSSDPAAVHTSSTMKSPTVHCVTDRVPLIEALRRVSVMSPDETRGVRWTLDGNALTVSSQHTGRGKGKQELTVQGEGAVEMGLDASFIVQALENISTDQVRLSFINHLSPCLIRPLHAEGDVAEDAPTHGDQLAVVMPMRL